MLNEYGFKRPSYDDILNKLSAQAKVLLGDDIDTSEVSIIGQILRVEAAIKAEQWEDCEGAYFSRFPNTASGVSLDRIGAYIGISRNAGTRAFHQIKLIGKAGHTIPMGFLVSTDTNIQFYTLENATMNELGEVIVNAECTQIGKIGNVTPNAIGQINTIVNPTEFVLSVEHLLRLEDGQDQESDIDFRVRFAATLQAVGSASADSIISNLMRVPGVQSVTLIENAESSSVDGRPPHSFEVFVLGGENYNIARAIFEKKPLGIKTVGNLSESVLDISGNPHSISFSRTNIIDLKVLVQVKVNSYFAEMLKGKVAIVSALSDMINNLKNGQTVIFTSLYSVLYQIEGVVDVPILAIATSGNQFATENISMRIQDKARLDAANINVEVIA